MDDDALILRVEGYANDTEAAEHSHIRLESRDDGRGRGVCWGGANQLPPLKVAASFYKFSIAKTLSDYNRT